MKTRGFTIVELLIVIVVIAILAAISVVAYDGIQDRARDSARNNAVSQLQQALESYRAIHNGYPSRIPIGSNAPSGFSGVYGNNYAYSVDTAGNWLAGLTTSGIINKVPIDPVNDNDHYFVYMAYGNNGTGKCNEPFYVLGVVGYENTSNIPERSKTLTCTWGGTVAGWNTGTTRAIFSNITTPPDP